MKMLGVGLIGYGFLKGYLYRSSASVAGRRLGIGIAITYVMLGVGLLCFG